jgi:23S rRNA (guanosine2251-2'-O)-methyltransferase
VEKREIISGRRAVLEYLTSLDSAEGVSLYISKTSHGKIIDTISEEARKRGITGERCDRGFLSRFDRSAKHQGVVLLAPRQRAERPRDFLKHTGEKQGVLVLLDHLTDPQNVGSIIRTAEALGADGVIIPKSQAVTITPAVIKASAGATAHITTITVPNIANFLASAKEGGFWIIGTAQKGNTDPVRARELKPAVIVIGSEEKGMRRLTEEQCDCTVSIPLKGKISSLNAAVAAGIILYEMLR